MYFFEFKLIQISYTGFNGFVFELFTINSGSLFYINFSKRFFILGLFFKYFTIIDKSA
jgi:hypothetical protein